MFNALKYTEKLERAGFGREQAETAVNVLIEIMEQNLATKQDILNHEIATHQEFKNMEQEFKNVRSEMAHEFSLVRHEMIGIEHRLTIKLGGMLAASIAIMATLNKVL